jgi:hypothetical protein
MVGGMVPSALMTLVVIPMIHALVKQPCPAPTRQAAGHADRAFAACTLS